MVPGARAAAKRGWARPAFQQDVQRHRLPGARGRAALSTQMVASGRLRPTPLPWRCPAGGEFFSHLKNKGKLSEEAARLYAGEVLLMFDYLHTQDIVYRDLKVRGGLCCTGCAG